MLGNYAELCRRLHDMKNIGIFFYYMAGSIRQICNPKCIYALVALIVRGNISSAGDTTPYSLRCRRTKNYIVQLERSGGETKS